MSSTVDPVGTRAQKRSSHGSLNQMVVAQLGPGCAMTLVGVDHRNVITARHAFLPSQHKRTSERPLSGPVPWKPVMSDYVEDIGCR